MAKILKTDGKAIIVAFIAIILGVVLIGTIADQETAITETKTNINHTVTLPTAIGETVELTGRDHISTTSVINASDANDDWSDNVTLSDGLGSDGSKKVILTLDDLTDSDGDEINGTDANVTNVYGPQGYLANSSDRAIIGLVIIFGALAILITSFVIVRLGTLGRIMQGG